MKRILASVLCTLAPLAALAQEKAAEAPAEQASPLVVVLFGVLFVGGCVGVLGYMWWQNKKEKEQGRA